jgi:hypothetical protein
MTVDERTQLVEDIRKSNTLRRGIVEMADRSLDFDIAAAWEDLYEIEASIARRIIEARVKPE